MARPAFNYHHLHYFWTVARSGGMARAAERLGVAVQTVSAQVRQLERDLGCALLRPAGRGLALTQAGTAALEQADAIFQLGEALPAAVRQATRPAGLRLAVGISDALPKLVVHRLLRPALQPGVKLLCHEGEHGELLAELALHKVDVVLADRPPGPNPNLRLYGHRLGAATLSWFAAPALARRAARAFPGSLADVPLLLPTEHWAIRAPLEQWLQRHGIAATVAGEIEDSALLKAFAADGLGAFVAADWLDRELAKRYGLRRVGRCDGVEERFYAIAAERKIAHPLVQRLLESARG